MLSDCFRLLKVIAMKFVNCMISSTEQIELSKSYKRIEVFFKRFYIVLCRGNSCVHFELVKNKNSLFERFEYFKRKNYDAS